MYIPDAVLTTLPRFFSLCILSGASRTTLHRVFTCAMSSKDYYYNIEQDFLLCIFVWSLKDNNVQGFYLCNFIPRVSSLLEVSK